MHGWRENKGVLIQCEMKTKAELNKRRRTCGVCTKNVLVVEAEKQGSQVLRTMMI